MMNCVIPGNNLRVLGKALLALCRFGDEIYIEPTNEKLSLRTVNSGKTAYAVIDFAQSYFSFYQLKQATDEAIGCLKWKLPMKALLNAFKNTAQLEKNVISCKIQCDVNSTHLLLKFRYKYDVIKTHMIHLLDEEALEAFYVKDAAVNKIIAGSTVFQHALQNFGLTNTEISAEVTEKKLSLRNYMNGEETCSKMMRTQLTIHSTDFLIYRIGQQTDIRFSLKLFRAAIGFADTFNLEVMMSFEVSGKPLIMVVKNNATFEINFVLSTLAYDGDTQSTIVGVEPIVKANSELGNHSSRKRKQSCDPNLSVQDSELLNSVNWDNMDSLNEDHTSEEIDTTHGRAQKVAKIVFQRCFSATFESYSTQDVLVPNSDEEYF